MAQTTPASNRWPSGPYRWVGWTFLAVFLAAFPFVASCTARFAYHVANPAEGLCYVEYGLCRLNNPAAYRLSQDRSFPDEQRMAFLPVMCASDHGATLSECTSAGYDADWYVGRRSVLWFLR